MALVRGWSYEISLAVTKFILFLGYCDKHKPLGHRDKKPSYLT
jgi:hypothetical protein